MTETRGGRGRWPVITAAFAIAAAGLLVWPDLAAYLEDRDGGAEPWRLLTGHLAHRSVPHALLCLLLFIPLGALWERRLGTLRFVGIYGILALGVAVFVRLAHDDWESYRGLSGVVYGLLALELIAPRPEPDAIKASARRARAIDPFCVARVSFALILAGKTLAELASAPAGIDHGIYGALSCRYLPGSHLGGLVAGGLIAVVLHTRNARSRRYAVDLLDRLRGAGASRDEKIERRQARAWKLRLVSPFLRFTRAPEGERGWRPRDPQHRESSRSRRLHRRQHRARAASAES